MKISYNWLKWYIPEIPEVDKLQDIFTFHLCEVESVEKREDGDTIFDINILPNRAHDLLSHQGVAYELSALCNIPYNDPTEKYKIPESKSTNLKINIESDKCRRYSARIVRNIKVGPSPDWVVKHLESIGQRSINNIVDATNLVLFDCGQPTHVFDLQKVGEKLRIKLAEEGSELELLGSEKINAKLKNSDLVIANDSGMPLAIAGVKGSTNSGVTVQTTDIILEVANFDPVSVRKTGRRLGLLSDAQKRFENDLSSEHVTYGMRELSATILEMCPDAIFEDIVDMYPNPPKETKIDVSLTYINNKLGSQFSLEEIENVWKQLKFEYPQEGDNFTINIPALRLDLVSPQDLVEEVGRVIGYDKIESILPNIDFKPKVNEDLYKIISAKKKFIEEGYREVMTYTFTKKGEVEVTYGAKGKEALRTNIADGLKESYELNKLNAPLLGVEDIKIFGIGNVFPKKNIEETNVAFIDKKNMKEISLEEFSSEVTVADSYTELFKDLNFKDSIFKMWSQYPFIVRDIAVWIPEGTDPKTLTDLYTSLGGELLINTPYLFDKFTKDNKTSLGYRLVFQAMDRTLTDEEINQIMSKIESEISKNKEFLIR